MSYDERQQRITLRLDDVPLELTVPASEERFYRRAEKYFNERTELYRRKYRLDHSNEEDRKRLTVFVALEIALMWQKTLEDKDPRPIVEELKHLCEDLQNHFSDTKGENINK